MDTERKKSTEDARDIFMAGVIQYGVPVERAQKLWALAFAVGEACALAEAIETHKQNAEKSSLSLAH